MSAHSERSQGDQDDIDYNITFPTGSSSDVEPVVLLLGWVGSKDKHLAKYSAVYEREGCITIRYIHPARSVFFTDPSESEHQEIVSLKLAQLLEDYDLVDNPVFVHVFSNGGYFLYRFLVDAFQERQVNLVGTIFDSCPGRLQYLIAVKAMLRSSVFSNFFIRILCAVAFTFYYFWLLIKYKLGFNKWPDLFEVMKDSPAHTWPHLFLYSSADVIVPHQHIEEMAEARRNAGSAFVQTYDFMTSPHVMHWIKFPEIYEQQCKAFLHECLKLDKGYSTLEEDFVDQSEPRNTV